MTRYTDWVTTPPLLVVISGPSGVGKTSVCRRLVQDLGNAVYSISVTTRPKRPGEVDGSEYFFVSPDAFEKLRSGNQLLESARVHEHQYGTPRPFVEAELGAGRIVVLNIDIQGGIQVMKSYPDGVFIFLLPPDDQALVARLTGRGEDAKEVIELRLRNAPAEVAHADRYEYIVINDDFDRCVGQIRAIVTAEQSLRRRCYSPGPASPAPGGSVGD